MKKSSNIITGITAVSLIAGMCVMPAVVPEMPVTAYAEDTEVILQDTENTELPSTTETTTTIQTNTESTTVPQTSESTESIQTATESTTVSQISETTESTTALQTSETTEVIQTTTKNIENISQNVKSTNKQLSDMIDMSAEYGADWYDTYGGQGPDYYYHMKFEGNNLIIQTVFITPPETFQFEIGEMTGENTFSLINGNLRFGEGEPETNRKGTLKVIDYNTIQIDYDGFYGTSGFYYQGFSKTFVNVAPVTTTTVTTTTTATTTTTTTTANVNLNNWQSAYTGILEKYISDGVPASAKFSLCYVDNDDIPELIVHSDGSGIHADTDVFLYTFYNGQVYNLGKMCYDGYTTFSYYEKSGVIITGWMNQGVEQRSIYKLINGSVSLIDSYSSDAEVIRDIGQYSLTKGNITSYLPASIATTARPATTTTITTGAISITTTANGSNATGTGSVTGNNDNNNTSGTTTTANNNSSSTTTATSAGKSSPKTGVASVGVAMTGIAVAIGTAFVFRKKNK